MPTWSPSELQLEEDIFTKLMHALFGFYAYVTLVALGLLSQLQLIPDANSFFPWTLIGTF